MAITIDDEFINVTVSLTASNETYSQIIPKDVLAEFIFRSGFLPATFHKSIVVRDLSDNIIREIR